MCGIAGIVTTAQCPRSLPEALARMADTLRHRGPDDEGYVLFSEKNALAAGGKCTPPAVFNSSTPYAPKCRIEELHDEFSTGLAHRRLAVIDLSEAAHQPMCSDDENLWIACNGEIYNYAELREEMQSMGMVFKTRSDIEVLLKAWQLWGIRCLARLNGMWAFVVYDQEKKMLFGARDRFGVKPLYYYRTPEFFAFASEQKALLASGNINTGVKHDAVFEHLLFGRVEIREEGFYQNILELPPSHYFMLDAADMTFSLRKYYQLAFNQESGKISREEATVVAAEVKERIFNAVSLRLRSDVPVGFCLSGGIDSSTIVCVSDHIHRAQPLKQLSEKLHTFTASHGGFNCDESAWAGMVTGQTGAEARMAPCRAEDILPGLEELVYHQDVPLYSTSTFAQSRVMKTASENNITILLDGQGGDELFGGYQTFYTSLLIGHLNRFNLRGLLREWTGLKNSPSSAGIVTRSMIKLMLDSLLSPGLKNRIAAQYRPELEYFDHELRREHSVLLNLAGEFSTMNVNQSLHHYFTGYYLKNLLRWEDRCSMQYSIESRTPFADDTDLIEYVFALPEAYKIHSGWSKFIMREAMKGIIPEPIRRRTDKLGFATPQDAWLTALSLPIKGLIGELASYDTEGMIYHQKLMKDWNIIFSKPALWKVRDMIWRYLNYLIWKKRFFTY